MNSREWRPETSSLRVGSPQKPSLPEGEIAGSPWPRLSRSLYTIFTHFANAASVGIPLGSPGYLAEYGNKDCTGVHLSSPIPQNNFDEMVVCCWCASLAPWPPKIAWDGVGIETPPAIDAMAKRLGIRHTLLAMNAFAGECRWHGEEVGQHGQTRYSTCHTLLETSLVLVFHWEQNFFPQLQRKDAPGLAMDSSDNDIEKHHIGHHDAVHDKKLMGENFDVKEQAMHFGKLSEEELIDEKRLKKKIDSVIMPMVVLVYLMNYIDRNNYPSAKLSGLQEDLKMSDPQFQTGLSILFVGYVLMQVPSNMFLVGPWRSESISDSVD